MAYEAGDRVIGNGVGNANVENAAGTVLYIKSTSNILVEFDTDIRGHDGIHACPVGGKDGHCWYCMANMLTLVKVKTIAEVEVEGKL